jgi:hypothetical protein
MNLSYLISEVEARDGIEPSNKALQTLPFSFWVPRHLSVGIVTTAKQALQGIRAAVLLVRLHEIPPRKESMKKHATTAACEGAYVTGHDLLPHCE